MRALISSALAIGLCTALSACDTLSDRTAAPLVSSSAALPPQLDDASLDASAEALLDGAQAYVGACWITGSVTPHHVDRCWPRGECPAAMTVNFDKNCGYEPSQPERVSKAARALLAAADKGAISLEAQAFIRNVELFDAFLKKSVRPSAWCLANTDAFYRPECWATTQGTVSRYQDLVKSFNAWRPKMRRRVLPKSLVGVVAGGVMHPFVHPLHPHREKEEARIAAEGLFWQRCADGPCLRLEP